MLSFKRMTDIEECFAGNGDDGSLIERQLRWMNLIAIPMFRAYSNVPP